MHGHAFTTALAPEKSNGQNHHDDIQLFAGLLICYLGQAISLFEHSKFMFY
ncbi:hypothetical protein AN958_00356 [Leucoagaricus sp. SymC.cos]|nr:hypothetical protein AN958_00356 [Leucoagaricus sp. SymC.cos]